MININRNNYEKYLIDYLDGTLSAPEREIVALFLRNNPDIRAEIEGLDQISLQEPSAVFEQKEALKKTVVLHNTDATSFEELCIGHLEGNLTQKQNANFYNALNESENKRKEYDLFKLTKLTVDHRIIYPDKLQLKRKSPFAERRAKRLTLISAAASLLVLISIYVFWPVHEGSDFENSKTAAYVKANSDKQSEKETTEQNVAILKSLENIKPTITNVSNNSHKQKVDIIEPDLLAKAHYTPTEQISPLIPVNISYTFKTSKSDVQLAVVIVTEYVVEPEEVPSQSIGDFLTSVVSKKLFKNKKEENIELFHIAQAGVKGINKLVGGNMSLERTFDEKGVPKTTEFTSNLVAFSTPVKKKSE